LAQQVDVSPDARGMTLRLRPGVRFHPARELTSQDLVWNFNRLKDPKVNPIYANLVKPFATMEPPDTLTLQVTFDAPNPFGGVGQIWQADLDWCEAHNETD
jgi:peptide/nickel transport system substrate-binding protein